MKIRLLSDLHLEFANYRIEELPKDNETVLLLAGDISVGKHARNFIERYNEKFRYIIYCLGNHEFYGKGYHKLIEEWKEVEIPNFHFMHDNSIIIDDVKFIGGTLWTNFFEGDEDQIKTAWMGMNDYYRIHLGDRYLKPSDTINFHNTTLNFIKEELEKEWEGKTVVMTHHLPCEQGIHPSYAGGRYSLNSAYYSNLEDFIGKYDIDVWAHGHSHFSHSSEVNNTLIVSNCRGYDGYEGKEKTRFNPTFRIEV